MFCKATFALSTLVMIATLGAGLTPASAKPIKMPHPHHFGIGWGAVGLLGAAAVIGTAAAEQSNCYVARRRSMAPTAPIFRTSQSATDYALHAPGGGEVFVKGFVAPNFSLALAPFKPISSQGTNSASLRPCATGTARRGRWPAALMRVEEYRFLSQRQVD
jgi:hypothetical protein